MKAEKRRPVSAEDLYRFELISGCEISPDGARVAFSLHRVDRKAEKRHAGIHLVSVEDGELRPFTQGECTDLHPVWSPDGKSLAFLSNRLDEKQFQIFIIPTDGGEARKLTDIKGTFGDIRWSPDGRRLLCSFRKKDDSEIEREQDERRKKLGVVSRRVTRLFFKEDNTGFLPRERFHLWVIDARTGRVVQITNGEWDERHACWSPDGKTIAFTSNRLKDPDMDPERIDLYTIPSAGGAMRKIDTPLGPKFNPSFSPDGRTLAYLGHEGVGAWWRNDDVWVVPADGSGKPRNLTGRADIAMGQVTIADLINPPTLPPAWSLDGRTIYFQASRHGVTTLMSVGAAGGRAGLATVAGGGGTLGWFSFDRRGRRLAYFEHTMSHPGRIWVKDLPDGAPHSLTTVNDALLRTIALGEVEETWFKGRDGLDLQGWILKPPGMAPGRHPAILKIHGGPNLQYGHAFMHEFQYLAGLGFVVFFTNPRGSRGYGEKHTKGNLNDWGSGDYDDLMAWTDLVGKKPYVDPRRLGVGGGSYGGYMTNWIIGHTERFEAAVTERSVSNLISMWGSSDFNWYFQQEFGNRPPWDNMANYWRQSPLKHIGNARTPTLILHAENDLRCAIEQGEQVFVALKRLGVETEMVRFPDESHELSRSGRTDRRVENLKCISGWFERFLKK